MLINWLSRPFGLQHPQICAFPSYKFYGENLKTGFSRLWQDKPLPFWPTNPDYNPGAGDLTGDPANVAIPHIFVDVRGDEETLTVTTDEGNERSTSNALEIEKVVRLAI